MEGKRLGEHQDHKGERQAVRPIKEMGSIKGFVFLEANFKQSMFVFAVIRSLRLLNDDDIDFQAAIVTSNCFSSQFLNSVAGKL